MVYTPKDMAHLDVMADLENDVPAPIDIKKVLALNNIEQPNDLISNIVTLASELRSNGFITYADDLEQKFLAYKSSLVKVADVHLYRAHDEDGEDLVDRAHPDGDINMGDGEHGDIETIISQHKKIVDVIHKTPTGKLGAYVNACKIALGQTAKDQFETQITVAMRKVQQNLNEIFRLAEPEVTYPLEVTKKALNELTRSTSWSNLVKLQESLANFRHRLSPGIMMGIKKETWVEQVEPLLNDCDMYVKDALSARKETMEIDRKERSIGNQTDIIKDYNTILQTINLYKEQVANKNLANAKDLSIWLDEASTEVRHNLDIFSKMEPILQLQSAPEYKTKLVTIKTQLDAMVKKWLV